MPLLQITSDQQGDVTGVLALDSSEFVGSLNFSTFRDALGSHLNQVLERLQKEDDDLSIFTAEDTGAMLFHIPGIVESDGQHNFLVTAIEQDKPGTIIIKLMFLNPDTYTRKDA